MPRSPRRPAGYPAQAGQAEGLRPASEHTNIECQTSRIATVRMSHAALRVLDRARRRQSSAPGMRQPMRNQSCEIVPASTPINSMLMSPALSEV